MKRIIFTAMTMIVMLSLYASAAEMKKPAAMPDHGIFAPADLKWMDAPALLPAGAKLAVLEGDPFKPGPFTMRLKMPAGYKIQPHWHPTVEHVTVVSGSFHIGMGDKFDETGGVEMTPGTFGFLAPKMHHFAWATEETVIQLHGSGPWKLIYLNPADDPSKMQKK